MLFVSHRRLIRNLLLLAAVCLLPISAQTQTLFTNGVHTFTGLTNATVALSGSAELRVTGTNTPLTGCLINLTSPDAFFVLTGIRPSTTVSTYMSQLRINGGSAVADSNCRVVEFGHGTVVVPHVSSFQPLRVFDGPYFTGASMPFSQHVYYKGTSLGALNGNISSFRLKRGYVATLAQNEDGTGASRCYVAQDGDMEVSLLPSNLNDNVRFVYVLPWRWVSKKGSCDASPTDLRATWWYNWNIDQNSTRDLQYVAIKQQPHWPGLNQNWQTRGVNHLLGFNEPNNSVEDAYKNLTPPGSVDDAVARWPELLGTGLRVGAPAVTDGGQSWITDFMNKADAAGHRVDYVPIHYYRSYSNNDNPSGAASQLYNFLKGIYDTVKRPLWVTEFNNGANWTGDADPTYAQNRAVIEAMINMMDNTPWIERYAVYSRVEYTRQTHYDEGGLTPMGVMYRDHIAPIAYLQGLPDNGTRSFSQLQFETNSIDSSGYGNNGVTTGSPAFTNGVRGDAMMFDGTNTVVTLPPNVARGGSFTFAAWINWRGGANWQRIFDFGNSTTHYMFLSPSSGSGTLRFAIKNGGGEQIVETAGLPQNQWRHVAITLSGNTARIYTNGVLAASNTGMSIAPSSFSPRMNFLGKSHFIADPNFRGLMDEVLITDYALTAAQVSSLATNTAPQFTNATVVLSNALQGQPYSENVAGMAVDADGGSLTYSKANGPAWLTVGAAGVLSGTPTGNDQGTNHFVLRATDFAGANAFIVATIVVESSLTGGPQLIAKYPFDGNANDTSGNAFHGTPVSSPPYAAGNYISAVNLDGTNDYVTLPESLFNGVTNFTIAAWVNWDGGNQWQRIFDFGNGTSQYLFLTPYSGGSTLRFGVKNGGTEQTMNATTLPTGQWRHVAVTLQGTTARMFVNGVQVAVNGAVTVSPATILPRVNYIGKSQWSSDPLFNGRIDEFYVFNYALSPTEVSRLAANQPPPPVTPTMMAAALSEGGLNFSWPASYIGVRLESNSVGLHAPEAWFTVEGSAATNQMLVPTDPNGTNIFFRLVYP